MREVAVIGAGELGGSLAHALARLDVARTVRLVDDSGRTAEGKALDIAQAAPVERFATHVSGSNDVSYAAGSDLVVIADRFGTGEWSTDDALLLLRQLARTTTAPILVAGISARAVIERGVLELKLPRTRLFGTAPEAFAAAGRALVALALNGSPDDLSLTILGRPPERTVVAWTEATFGGFPVTKLLDEPVRIRLNRQIAALWPPGPLALAAAAAKAVACMDGRLSRIVNGFIAPDTSAGVRARVAALPVRLGPQGVVTIMTPRLSAAEQVAFDNAVMV
jgi:malate dehydrogenase